MLLLIVPTVAHGWNGTGHMVIAATAYRQLPPEVRARLVEILRHHPDYARWNAEAPDPLPNDDEGVYLFMRASAWADDIRQPGADQEATHARWHFIQIPLSEDGPGPIPTNDDNILAGIAASTTGLNKWAQSQAERAVHLAWLIHLVGDIHQPMHCVSMFDAAHPDGDLGGNRVRVAQVPGGSRNLHGVWDTSLGGQVDDLGNVIIASQTVSRLPSLSLDDLSAQLTPERWARDSARVAFQRAYVSGTLVPPSPSTPVILSADYLENVQTVAETRAVLAGYRLAKLLERVPRSPISVGTMIAAAALAGALLGVFLYRRRFRSRISCFISYSSEDETFAKQLKYDLDARGFRCWFAKDDLQPGARIDPALRREIEKHDRVILILSAHSIASAWVGTEVDAVRAREEAAGATILLPIRVDPAVLTTQEPWAASIRRERNIGDFSAWEDDHLYQRALERLVQSLGKRGEVGHEP